MDTIRIDDITKKRLLKGLSTLLNQKESFIDNHYNWCISTPKDNIIVSISKEELDEELKYIKANLSFEDNYCINNIDTKMFEKIVQSFDKYNDIHVEYRGIPLDIRRASKHVIVAYICYMGSKYPKVAVDLDISMNINGLDDFIALIDIKSIQTVEVLDRTLKNDLANLVLYSLARKHKIYYIDFISRITIKEGYSEGFEEYNDLIESYIYRKEPLRYYLQAFSFGHPLMQYLAFYHVIEFFLGGIQEQQAIKLIDDELKDSTWNNDTDHRKQIYKIVKAKCLRNREIDLLHDCLASYLTNEKVPSLFDRIEELFPGSEDYYSNYKVSFATSEETRIARIAKSSSADKEYGVLIDRLAKRIYKTRNFFVHSKEGEEKQYRYEPFEHDELIEKELPLVQSVAEVFLEANRRKRRHFNLLDYAVASKLKTDKKL